MKDFVISLILIVILTLLFSTVPLGEVLPSGGIDGTLRPGDSGMILPGGDAGIAEVDVRREERVEEPSETSDGTDEAETGEQIPVEIEMEVQTKMDNMWLFFWYGVVAVLLGETVALMVAAAWMRILVRVKNGGGKNG